MADRVEQFEVTVAAGTARSAPVEIATTFNPGIVEEIEIVVPDGVSGLAGIALLLAHSQLVPETRGSFIISNDEVIHWPMDGLPNSGAWSAWLFNTDTWDHTFYVRFLVREIGSGIVLSEPTAPGQATVIGIGQGDLGDGTPITVEEPPPEELPPIDSTGEEPPPVDSGDTGAEELPAPEPVDDLPPEPVDDLPPEPAQEELPAEPPVEEPVADTPLVAVAVPAVIASYGLPADYNAGAVPLFGNPGNLGMLIGIVLGYKQVGSGSNTAGSFNTWRFFSNLGNTADWNFYTSGAKRLQWVGPFNLRTGVPAG